MSLATLPEPQLVQELDFETILATRKTKLSALYPPIKGVLNNPNEPAVALLEEASWREIWLRNLFNQAFRSRLLFFAQGAELDHVADSYGVQRLKGESDTELKSRTRIKNRGSSAAGPDDWWKFHARSADEQVEDVAVTRPGGRGVIELAILAKTATGVADQHLLKKVLAHVSSPKVRNVGASVRVVAASGVGFQVAGRVLIEPSTAPVTAKQLESRLREAMAQRRGLGTAIYPSWISGQLHQPGVVAVELTSPSTTISVANNQSAVLESVSLEVSYV